MPSVPSDAGNASKASKLNSKDPGEQKPKKKAAVQLHVSEAGLRPPKKSTPNTGSKARIVIKGPKK